MLQLTPDVRDLMLAHALQGLPREACGMFSSRNGTTQVDLFHPMRNTAESDMLFALDGQEMLDLEKLMEQSDRALIGVMHSHATTSAYPSPTDVRDSGRFDPLGTFQHVIVSLRHAEPVMRCYRMTHDTIVEIPIVVSNGNDDTQHDGEAIAVAVALRPANERG